MRLFQKQYLNHSQGFFQKLRALLICFSLGLVIAGCSTHKPSQIALNPMVPQVEAQTHQYTALAIQTLDTRSANYIVRFNNKGDAAKLVSPSEPPRKQLHAVFESGFTRAGYKITPNANRHIKFELQQLLTDVDESLFSFVAKHQIVIRAVADNDNKQLIKTFSAKGKLEGPLKADFATLELDMNKLLLQITSDIINDDEINQFFK